MEAINKQTQSKITPEKGLELLKEGNQRFQSCRLLPKGIRQQIEATSSGQFPFATILSCIDSRVPPEMIFDQSLGDLFSIRVAGNIVNDDVLASIEFATKLAGSKLVVVLGHTSCGAVNGACSNAKLGKLTGLLEKVKPAIDQVESEEDHPEFSDSVSQKNVELSLVGIRQQSVILREMEENGEIKMLGAMYDIKTGEVKFMN